MCAGDSRRGGDAVDDLAGGLVAREHGVVDGPWLGHGVDGKSVPRQGGAALPVAEDREETQHGGLPGAGFPRDHAQPLGRPIRGEPGVDRAQRGMAAGEVRDVLGGEVGAARSGVEVAGHLGLAVVTLARETGEEFIALVDPAVAGSPDVSGVGEEQGQAGGAIEQRGTRLLPGRQPRVLREGVQDVVEVEVFRCPVGVRPVADGSVESLRQGPGRCLLLSAAGGDHDQTVARGLAGDRSETAGRERAAQGGVHALLGVACVQQYQQPFDACLVPQLSDQVFRAQRGPSQVVVAVGGQEVVPAALFRDGPVPREVEDHVVVRASFLGHGERPQRLEQLLLRRIGSGDGRPLVAEEADEQVLHTPDVVGEFGPVQIGACVHARDGRCDQVAARRAVGRPALIRLDSHGRPPGPPRRC